MSEQPPVPVVVLGGSFNSLSVIRALARQGIPVYALADGAGGALASRSRYLRAYVPVGSSATAPEEWWSWLRSGPTGAVLLPCSDAALQFLAEHRDQLIDKGYRPADGVNDVTLALLDKERTYELARSVGVPAPRTAMVRSVDDVRRVAASMDFPCALKPRHSHLFARAFGTKLLLAEDAEALERAYLAAAEHGLEMIVTEIIPGDDAQYCSYYSYLDSAGTPLFHFTKRKLRQNPPGFGLGTYHVSDWVPDAAEMGLRFFQGVGLRGVGNVEFKRDSRDGQLKIIESNPRFTAADKLVQRAGIDMATISYRRTLGLPVDPPTGFRSGVRQWHPLEDLHAFRSYRRVGQLGTVAWLRSLVPFVGLPMFDLRDPVPSLVVAAGFLRRALAFVRRRVAPSDRFGFGRGGRNWRRPSRSRPAGQRRTPRVGRKTPGRRRSSGAGRHRRNAFVSNTKGDATPTTRPSSHLRGIRDREEASSGVDAAITLRHGGSRDCFGGPDSAGGRRKQAAGRRPRPAIAKWCAARLFQLGTGQGNKGGTR